MAMPEDKKTFDGFDQQFGVNHLAHFTLTALLLSVLLKSGTPSFNSSVVLIRQLPDINFTGAYNPWVAYVQSKTAKIWMANYIDRVYGSRGIHANSVRPDGILTALHQHVSPEMALAWQQNAALQASLRSPEQGAATTMWAATAGIWEGKGGK
ncbi:Dehydrogenase/reductase SDR family member on chromosome X [Colletotrichum chlorophyti]|uniref:Dehydrogenase/reductase SDR family member on chromosome X n=1 Tax=Colletotrichum chlorophyti TaxID=708187 RepID=A0A1Q8S3M0_9PEZI|nr:Dehydrogenase/reductase SDR family member on chromosome X [Colletotrichum chlorophyti]